MSAAGLTRITTDCVSGSRSVGRWSGISEAQRVPGLRDLGA
jgi:hypothetical protein